MCTYIGILAYAHVRNDDQNSCRLLLVGLYLYASDLFWWIMSFVAEVPVLMALALPQMDLRLAIVNYRRFIVLFSP